MNPDTAQPLVTIATYTDAIEAHIARGRLDAEGIAAFTADEHLVWADWSYSNALGGVKLRVAHADAARALAVLQELHHGAYALPEPGAARCPACGASDPVADRRTFRIALASLFLIAIPLPFTHRGLRCERCAHRWRST